MATLPLSGNINFPTEIHTRKYDHRRANHILLIVPAAAPPDIVAPTIVDFDPPLGTVLEANQPVSFRVLDNLGLFARIIVAVRFTDGVEELIHDGDAFTGFYVLQSSRAVIASGFRYTLLRRDGWPTRPTFRAFPIDSSGNDGT